MAYSDFHKIQKLYRSRQGNDGSDAQYGLFFKGWNFPSPICTCVYDKNYHTFMEQKKKFDCDLSKKDYIIFVFCGNQSKPLYLIRNL